jgi:hypothetical protein
VVLILEGAVAAAVVLEQLQITPDCRIMEVRVVQVL